MSAFIIQEKTMSGIIYNLFWTHDFKDTDCLMAQKGYKEAEDYDRLAIELFTMNRDAVQQRYDEPEDSDYIKIPEKVNWNEGKLDIWQTLKSLKCLRYQCSEGNVPESEMYKFLEKIIRSWTDYCVETIPEYQKAKWD